MKFASLVDLKIVDGQWANWFEYSPCNATCGGGFRIIQRSCTNPKPANGGNFCLLSNSKVPVRSNYEERCITCFNFLCSSRYTFENAEISLGKLIKKSYFPVSV